MIDDEICTHISVTERNAQKCEYSCFDRYSAQLAENYLDKKMSGIITHISEAGLFIRLDKTRVEGFLPARLLFPRRQNYQRGQYQQRASLNDFFTTQQKIDIIVMEADPLTANVTFAPADDMKLGKDKGKDGDRRSSRKDGGGRSSGGRSDDRRSDDKKPSGGRTFGNKKFGKPNDRKQDDRKQDDRKQGGYKKPTTRKPANNKPANRKKR